MPSWWGKSSSKKGNRKENRESIIETIQRKLKSTSGEKRNDKSRGSRRHHNEIISEKGSRSLEPSRSSSPSTHVSRCQSFAQRPRAQPLPLPGLHLPSTNHANSGISVTSKLESNGGSKPSLYFPLPKPGYVSNREEPADAEGDIATASVSSGSSTDSDDQSDSHFLSPVASDCENGNRTTIHGTFSVAHNDQSPITLQKNSRASSKPAPQLCNHQLISNSPKMAPLHLPNLQIACSGGLWSAPDSSMSSPSRSPVRTFGLEQVLNSGLCTGKLYSDIASGHCSSPGSGYNSGHNSVGGDLSGQTFWMQSRCSPECSPIPSPGMTSPSLSSRIHSGAVTPLHPRARGAGTQLSTRRPDDAKQRTHRLPLPPITIPNSCPFSPTYCATTSTSAPRSPGISENITSPGSRWKKGQLLGRGTFGHVYLGFNSESGEMCAMKEVTLFSDDAKSRESEQQLGQEIALLSRLRHPNIVQYYGSETVDDKLYIYLEYVSGGSIYKLLQQYGQLGEIAIRNYTRQILLGLAYLHAKNTVHRDIKGANILVDPNGRVKLADFGMAKHISGQSCPLSFKGSPYWMAPEVIKNSNGCNLAVDIWSLGCTVLEMATTKPPWSQYEGVAALFKIGNSKELPAIPDRLSEDGKDFVRLCLQRNPLCRPSAAQLLMHPFVKKATPERSVLSADPSEATPAITNAVRSLAIGPAKHNLYIDSEVAGIYLSRSLRTGSGLSDTHIPRNVSRPVSPTRSSLLHSRSLHMSGRMSPSPISSPHTASGSSTPLTGGCGAIPFHQTKQPTFSFEGVGVSQRTQNGLYSHGNTAYQERKNEPFWGILQTAYACPDIVSSNNDALGNHNRRAVQGVPREFYDGKSYLTDCVSLQLLSDHVRLNSSLNLNPNAPLLCAT
ncbi:LOW QUALITY PROTEIN: mitogen-activated protein kinase kinase kinase YODA-like [Gastrolobium bilobum]|uniref:LOW QUALITY PROTEIN: mitogen-activated protein kinase kinase kinase YODA-like n=1 Tax=Gastrolobium bilobum TaxID=150636 RepID=UPI002AAF5033|nr:LOW QUALITY PROTEIN: mitogen-activated protein kinase kinase kinase YODA-like [Gastrolobium bilobum]